MNATAAMSSSRFLDLPAELRLEIYDLVFSTSRPMDLLANKNPDNALRATCKFIHAESESAFERASHRHPQKRNDLLKELVTKQQNEGAVSPHRSIVFYPPIGRAAELFFSINSQCLHACAVDGCYMCDDKVHRTCFDCGRNVAIALWCFEHPEDSPELVEKGSGGTRLTPLGEFIRECRPTAERRIKARVDRSKVDRWWQRELDVQIAIDYRCELRRDAVAAFWTNSNADSTAFTADNMAILEACDTGMAEFDRVARLHGGEAAFLDWEPEYERRVRQRVAAAAAQGISLPPQIPVKRDAEKLRTLQRRIATTTLIGRRNKRDRVAHSECRMASLLERRARIGRGVQMPTLVLPPQ